MKPRTSKVQSRKDPRVAAAWIVAIVLVLSWISIARSTWRPAPAIDRWTIADWLINYSGGSVRRGLFGELVSRVTLDSQAAATAVILSQLLLLLCLYTLVFLLFLCTARSVAWIALVLSPAFLLFPLLSYQGGLRKELLTLSALAALGLVIARRMNPWWILAPFGVYVLASFSHETAALSLAAFVYLIWLGQRNGSLTPRVATFLIVAWTLVSLGSLAFAFIFSGSANQASDVCQFWLDRGSSEEVCAGAIAAVGGSPSEAILEVIGRFPEYFAYPPLAMLAAVPLVALRATRSLWILAAILYVSFVPLFLTGIDYGRWIYLATALVSICALAVLPSLEDRAIRIPTWAGIVFIVGWTLPYTGPVLQEPLYGRILYSGYEAVLRLLS